MRAPWAQTSLVAESLWLLQKHVDVSTLVEGIKLKSDAKVTDGRVSSKSEYDAMFDSLSGVPIFARQLLQMSLSVRDNSPLVELINSLVADLAATVNHPTEAGQYTQPLLSIATVTAGTAVVRVYTNPTDVTSRANPAALFSSPAGAAFAASEFDTPVVAAPSGTVCPVSADLDAPTVALYLPTSAVLGLPTSGTIPASKWLAAAKAIAAACPDVIVVIRPFGRTGSGRRPILIGGYGAELQLRNVEYKAHDDSANATAVDIAGTDGTDAKAFASASASAVAELEREVENAREFGSGGLNVDRLAKAFPSAAAALREYIHIAATESDASKVGIDDAGMKVWLIEALGLQAASRVLDAADPVSILRAVAGNFPKLFSTISETLRNTDAYKRKATALAANTDALVTSGVVQDAGVTSPLFINGRAYPLSKLSAFTLAAAVDAEARVASALVAAGVGEADVATVAAAPLALKGGDAVAGSEDDVVITDYRFRVKIGGGNVLFLNNPETDPAYTQRFASTVTAILQTDMWGRRSFAAKNLYTGVLFIDPSNRRDLGVLHMVRQIISIPVRIGFVFMCPSTVDAIVAASGTGSGAADADKVLPTHTNATRVAAVLHHVATTFGPRIAYELLSYATEILPAGEAFVTVDTLATAWPQVMQTGKPADHIAKAVGNSKIKKKIVDAMKNLVDVGFTHAPAGVMNGIYFASQSSLDEGLVTAFRHEQRTVPVLVQEGILTDSTKSLHRAILDYHSALPRFSGPVFARAAKYAPVPIAAATALHRAAAPAIAPLAQTPQAAASLYARRKEATVGAFNVTKAVLFERPIPVDVPVIVVGDVASPPVAAAAAAALRSVSAARARLAAKSDDDDATTNAVLAVRVVASRASPAAVALAAALADTSDVAAADVAATAGVFSEVDPNVLALVEGRPAAAGTVVGARGLAAALKVLDAVVASRAGGADAPAIAQPKDAAAAAAANAIVAQQVAAAAALPRAATAAAAAGGVVLCGGRIVPIPATGIYPTDVQMLAADELTRRLKPLLASAGPTPSAFFLLASATARTAVLSHLADDAIRNGARAIRGVPPRIAGTTDYGVGFDGLAKGVPARIPRRCRELLGLAEGVPGVADTCTIGGAALAPASLTTGTAGGAARVPHRGIAVDVRIVVNPVDLQAAKAAAMVDMLRTLLPSSAFSIHLNPSPKVSEMPTRSFFRYVLAAGITFTPAGDVSGPMAVFTGVPPDDVVTVQVPDHVPDSWVVTAAAALPDICLDNVVLRKVPASADAQRVLGASPDRKVLIAQYEIDALTVSGSCIDGTRGTPVGGLPLVLVPAAPLPPTPWLDVRADARADFAAAAAAPPPAVGTPAHETVVIGSLLYYQLQAPRPGRYAVRIAPGTRAERIFVLGEEEAPGAALRAPADAPPTEVPLVVWSFGGAKNVALSAVRRAGMEEAPLHLPPPPLDPTNVGKALKGGTADDEADLPPAAWRAGGVAAVVPSAAKGSALATDEEEVASGGWWRSMFGGASGHEANLANARSFIANSADDSTLNIFSVATGRLYERFMQVMIHSVMRTVNETYGLPTIDAAASLAATAAAGGELKLVYKDPSARTHNVSLAEKPPRVRFWLLSNFMSGPFRRFLRVFSRLWGFDVECVTYKWPEWLRAQTVRQRQIWAYKMLFLDTLFPPSLKRVLYIDSDLVVRSDLHELYHRDLGAAPYAFTPFCDSRKETEGYRFWKGGSWGQLLQGRPYHISALYLVDLNRFRRTMTGDNLRYDYHRLSADPNNLANLDQDLPNYLQSEVPIHSLPLEWLWCETWCADSDLPAAKVIDMCNNPLTKVPKLEAAKRVEPRWSEWDELLRSVEAYVDKTLGTLVPSAMD